MIENGGDLKSDFVTAGRVLDRWGLKGEVKVDAVDLPSEYLLAVGAALFELKDGRAIRHGFELTRYISKKMILKLDGVDSVEAAAEYRGALIKLQRSALPALPEGHYYHFELTGLEVVTTGGQSVGRLSEILDMPANDVYVVHSPEGAEFLIPAVADVVKDIDTARGVIVIDPLEGMLE
jgi:16S rRNA processing protein RimM